jgi:hypothetical protein
MYVFLYIPFCFFFARTTRDTLFHHSTVAERQTCDDSFFDLMVNKIFRWSASAVLSVFPEPARTIFILLVAFRAVLEIPAVLYNTD